MLFKRMSILMRSFMHKPGRLVVKRGGGPGILKAAKGDSQKNFSRWWLLDFPASGR